MIDIQVARFSLIELRIFSWSHVLARDRCVQSKFAVVGLIILVHLLQKRPCSYVCGCDRLDTCQLNNATWISCHCCTNDDYLTQPLRPIVLSTPFIKLVCTEHDQSPHASNSMSTWLLSERSNISTKVRRFTQVPPTQRFCSSLSFKFPMCRGGQ